MNPASRQLQIPDRTTGDPKAFEIVRVWVAHGEQHVAIRVVVEAEGHLAGSFYLHNFLGRGPHFGLDASTANGACN
jgi:hypothetical protein